MLDEFRSSVRVDDVSIGVIAPSGAKVQPEAVAVHALVVDLSDARVCA
jgi:hypothetical protein